MRATRALGQGSEAELVVGYRNFTSDINHGAWYKAGVHGAGAEGVGKQDSGYRRGVRVARAVGQDYVATIGIAAACLLILDNIK